MRMDPLRCPVCSQLLRDPVTVPCGHNFCSRCIQSRWDRDESSKSPCACPECGSRFPSRPPLIRNTTLAKLATERGAQLNPGAATPTPKRSRRAPENGKRVCLMHNMFLDVYCCTDQRVVCAGCAAADHGGHDTGSVPLERKRRQEELVSLQMKSKEILQKQKNKSKILGKTLSQIQGEARKTEDYCEAVLVEVIDSLQRHYQSVSELIGAQEKEAAAQVQTSLKKLQQTMEDTMKRSTELDGLAQTDDDVLFLQKWPLLQQLCAEEHLRPLCQAPEDPLLTFKSTKRAVDELGKELKKFCDKEFASICQTGGSEGSGGRSKEDNVGHEPSTSQSHGSAGLNNALTVQTVTPKTRAEFLQYACDLNLDPCTAHEDLVISEGDKKVKLIPLKSRIPGPRDPNRFMNRRQVLCREGLQAERCYYEIEVEGGKAEVALTYKGIDRRSLSSQSAFGGNANSWSLDRSTKYSVSHRGNSVQLTMPPRHRRIGVYLEFKEGSLSFYEVSDSMEFLYKLKAKFTEPLYPGFWLEEKCCIRICDLTQDR